ncbi:glycolipid transfer protein-like [Amyelois transitella]|uniref:glycolipid transfer protein-like n=1 Tax=Amyelois transitella TaxID=680683 RepID=UPI00067C97DA|nr:glycolipid transfer protein-like [Amyelois transitella]
MFYENMTPFPPVINGRINIVQFIEAASDLVALVDRIGKVFAPVKYDMQGNIDKIKKCYKFDDTSCLLELMLEEVRNGKHTAAEGILWLNRALYYFELVLQEVVRHLKSNNYDVNMDKIFNIAYEGSLKKYHNWITQQIFAVICKMSPTLPQLMKSLDVGDDIKPFETKINNFIVTIHLVRCKIDDFFKDNDIFTKPK